MISKSKISNKNLYFIRHEHSCANQLEKILGEKFKYKIGFPGIRKGFFKISVVNMHLILTYLFLEFNMGYHYQKWFIKCFLVM